MAINYQPVFWGERDRVLFFYLTFFQGEAPLRLFVVAGRCWRFVCGSETFWVCRLKTGLSGVVFFSLFFRIWISTSNEPKDFRLLSDNFEHLSISQRFKTGGVYDGNSPTSRTEFEIFQTCFGFSGFKKKKKNLFNRNVCFFTNHSGLAISILC